MEIILVEDIPLSLRHLLDFLKRASLGIDTRARTDAQAIHVV